MNYREHIVAIVAVSLTVNETEGQIKEKSNNGDKRRMA